MMDDMCMRRNPAAQFVPGSPAGSMRGQKVSADAQESASQRANRHTAAEMVSLSLLSDIRPQVAW